MDKRIFEKNDVKPFLHLCTFQDRGKAYKREQKWTKIEIFRPCKIICNYKTKKRKLKIKKKCHRKKYPLPLNQCLTK